MVEHFYSTTTCDRCGATLTGKPRTMSWFTDDCICSLCKEKEMTLRCELEKLDIDTSELEGIGKMPTIQNGKMVFPCPASPPVSH